MIETFCQAQPGGAHLRREVVVDLPDLKPNQGFERKKSAKDYCHVSQLKKTCGKPTKATVTVAKKPSGLKCCTCDFDLDPKTIVPGGIFSFAD